MRNKKEKDQYSVTSYPHVVEPMDSELQAIFNQVGEVEESKLI